MADQRITQLTALSASGVADIDLLPIVDISASETKKVTAKDLITAGVALINSSTIDIAKINQASVTKLGTTSLADDAITAAKLADDSSVSTASTAPASDNLKDVYGLAPLIRLFKFMTQQASPPSRWEQATILLPPLVLPQFLAVPSPMPSFKT